MFSSIIFSEAQKTNILVPKVKPVAYADDLVLFFTDLEDLNRIGYILR